MKGLSSIMYKTNENNFICFLQTWIRYIRLLLFSLLVMFVVSSLTGCGSDFFAGDVTSKSEKEAAAMTEAPRRIYLYGEAHGNTKIMDKEYELWSDYYHNKGMRHLFLELSYFTAEYLNLWMQSDNDEILGMIYDDWEGTSAHTPYTKTFLRKIKIGCPETVFHGTDVGHQGDTTGKQFLSYLEESQQTDSEKYTLTKEAIEQGQKYYREFDGIYRENKMTENFIRAFEQLGGESVMGIYGSAHTGIDEMDYYTQSSPSMANQLHKRYGDDLYTENLSWMANDEDDKH